MEPCAPGTEDDPPIMFSTLTKQENEKERLLSLKATLRNGRYENIFELSYVGGAEHWFCKACECPVMGRVFQHEIGKRHTANLSNFNKFLDPTRSSGTEEVPAHDQPEEISIAPGEPVPPGFEDEITRVAQIQERLDGFKVGPLVALEYLVELQDYDTTKEPLYLCILCDKRGDPRTVLTHLASYNHITQYLQKHFPTCYRTLAPYMTKQYKRNWQTTLQKVAEGIEKKFGRLKPFPIDKDKFENDRMQYLTMIAKGRHFSELSGYTFEELVVHDELTKTHEDEKPYESSVAANWGGQTYIEKPFKKKSPSPPVVAMPKKTQRAQQPAYVAPTTNKKNYVKAPSPHAERIGQNRRQSLSSVSSVSSNEMDDRTSRKRSRSDHKVDRFGRNRSPPSKGMQLPYPRRRSLSRSPSPRRRGSPYRRSPSPRRRNERDRHGGNVNDKENEKLRKIEEYRKLARAIENDMQNTLKHHEKHPEKHPHYNDEWKKFWNRRYKELQSQGVDVAKHDFKPEWIQYWNRRMVELHSDELRNKKDALRKRLALPEDVNPIKFKISNQNPSPNLPMAAQPDQDNEVIVIHDEDSRRSRNRSHSPWEKELSPRPKSFKRSPERSRERSPMVKRGRPNKRSRSNERFRRRSRSSRSLSREKEIKSRNSSRSQNVSSPLRDREREYSKNLSHSPYRDSPFREKQLIRERDMMNRERRSNSRERNWEMRMEPERRRMEYRESSYERDMRGRERVRTVADLPWEREKAFRVMYDDYYRPPPVMRDVTRKPVSIPPDAMMPPEEEEDDGEVNVVDVLRILTALEERLGSLGPKVIDLLAQALAMEKKEANSSENLLDNDINCVLFETVKEKLKGQMLTGLVDMIQERAFKKAIKKIASLIHLSNQRKKQRDKFAMRNKSINMPGVGSVDRNAIAKQIANALILQGKTDVTQAELEQLINVVVGMQEASKNSNKPVTAANFLQQIPGTLFGNNQPMTTESGDKIIIPTSAKKEIVDLDKLVEPISPTPDKNLSMENLSDSDLKMLLQNFKDLCTEEQHNLINYLKKMEDEDPERVEHLRQFVNLEIPSKTNEDDNEPEREVENKKSRESPFSERKGGANPSANLTLTEKIESDEELNDNQDQTNNETKKQKPTQKIHVDSEEEDYTFEDVVKTVSRNVNDKELANKMKIVEECVKFDSAKKSEENLTSAKDLISNLMSNINKSNTNKIDLLGLGNPNTPTSNLLTNSSEFAKTFSNINMANLASIVNNVRNMTGGEQEGKTLNFEPPDNINNSTNKLTFEPPPFSLDKGNYNDRFEAPERLAPPEPLRLAPPEPLRLAPPEPLRLAPPDPRRLAPPEPLRLAPPEPLRLAPPEPLRLAPPEPLRLAPPEPLLGNRTFGGPGKMDDKLSPGGPGRLVDRLFASGSSGRLDERGFSGRQSMLDNLPPIRGSGGLDSRSYMNRPGLLGELPLSSGGLRGNLNDRAYLSKLDDQPFGGPLLGRMDSLSRPFQNTGAGAMQSSTSFSRGSMARGSGPMMEPLNRGLSGSGQGFQSSFSSNNVQPQARSLRPNIPDQRPRFSNNFNDFSRPGGNFNRW